MIVPTTRDEDGSKQFISGVVNYLYFGRLLHVDMLVDVPLDETLFLLLLPLNDLPPIFLLVAQHIGLKTDVVLL